MNSMAPCRYILIHIVRTYVILAPGCPRAFFFGKHKIIIMKCKMNKIYNNNKQWVNEKDVGQFIHPEGCHPRMLQE